MRCAGKRRSSNVRLRRPAGRFIASVDRCPDQERPWPSASGEHASIAVRNAPRKELHAAEFDFEPRILTGLLSPLATGGEREALASTTRPVQHIGGGRQNEKPGAGSRCRRFRRDRGCRRQKPASLPPAERRPILLWNGWFRGSWLVSVLEQSNCLAQHRDCGSQIDTGTAAPVFGPRRPPVRCADGFGQVGFAVRKGLLEKTARFACQSCPLLGSGNRLRAACTSSAASRSASRRSRSSRSCSSASAPRRAPA